MRIVYGHYLSDANHPAVRMVEHIASRLILLGHAVHVHAAAGLTHDGGRVAKARSSVPPQISGFTQRMRRALWFAKESNRSRAWLAGDKAQLRKFRPDVVLARQDAYCWSIAQAAASWKIPMVTYADAPVAYESRMFNDERRWHPPGLVERIEAWGLRQSQAVITVSHPAKSRLLKYGLNVPIHVISNGVDASQFTVLSDEQRRALRHEIGIDAPLVLGFQGTFRSFHGIDRLRDLMLATSGKKNVQWLLIGDGPERASLESSMVAEKVHACFLGQQPAAAMPRLLSLIDIAVAPHAQMAGDFYFCPLKILEYGAAGCAIVASDQGDIPQLLAHGDAGMIVSSDDASAWSSALIQLIGDPARAAALGQAAREHVLKHLTWDATAKRVESVLCSVSQR